jgi:two-component system, NarL family, response regulator DesR
MTSEERAVRVLLIERMNLLRGALACVLSAEGDLDVSAAVADLAEAAPIARAVRPDVAVVDIDLLPDCGVAGIQRLGEALPGCATVVIADRGSTGSLRAALATHVDGLVSKDALPSRLAEGIRRVARGERVIDPALAIAALRAPRNPLTVRELDVLRVLAMGLPSAEIAAKLDLRIGTVCNYVSTIIRKTGARNRMEAVRIAEDSGWL